jgi:hypothetical protein
MFITRRSLPRRTFLRGMGVTLALPLLDAMIPAMTAQSRTAAVPVRRFGAVYVPHGKILSQWTPAAQGTGFEFTPILEPLEAFRDHLCVVSGLDGPKDPAAGGHATAPAMWLTGITPKKTEGVDVRNETTIDQVIAKAIGQDTPFPSLELATEDFTGFVGACDVGYSCTYMNTISWQGPTTPLPMEINPRVVFERLFGGTGSVGERLERLRTRRSILDSVSKSTSRLQQGLGARDRSRLSEYLEHVREIERRILRSEQNTSADLAVPEAPIGTPDAFEEHVGLMFDLVSVAFQADITRVFSFMMARDLHNRTYPQVGVDEPHHGLSHHQNKADKMARFARINTYHVDLFGRFLRTLDATSDGDGTLLDHSIVLYGSGMGNANLHSHVALPYLVAGTGSGAIKGGRHIQAREHDPSGNLLLSLVDKFGIARDRVGYSTGRVDL